MRHYLHNILFFWSAMCEALHNAFDENDIQAIIWNFKNKQIRKEKYYNKSTWIAFFS